MSSSRAIAWGNKHAIRVTTGAVRRSPQLRRSGGDHYGMYECASCAIHYPVLEEEKALALPACPMCAMRERAEAQRREMESLQSRLDLANQQLRALTIQVDLLQAMHSAVDLLDEHDRRFLKSVLYRRRSSQSRAVQLKPTMAGRGAQMQANGFVAHGEAFGTPEAHTCSSIGGIALANYYAEAARSYGQVTAMNLLLRAMNACLNAQVTS